MARARTALLAAITVLAVLVVGSAKVAATPAPAPSSSGPGTVCVVNQARCTPLVPGGSVSVAARVMVTVGAVVLGGSALAILLRARRRAPRLATGFRPSILRPPRGSFRIA